MKLIIQASDGLTPEIPALERLRQKDHHESEASLVSSFFLFIKWDCGSVK